MAEQNNLELIVRALEKLKVEEKHLEYQVVPMKGVLGTNVYVTTKKGLYTPEALSAFFERARARITSRLSEYDNAINEDARRYFKQTTTQVNSVKRQKDIRGHDEVSFGKMELWNASDESHVTVLIYPDKEFTKKVIQTSSHPVLKISDYALRKLRPNPLRRLYNSVFL